MLQYESDIISNYFIDKGCGTYCKLRNLVYFAHGWHLVLKKTPLLRDGVRAGRYGIEISGLEDLEDSWDGRIFAPFFRVRLNEAKKLERYIPDVSNEECPFLISLLDRIWEVYGGFDRTQLNTLAPGSGTPWWVISTQFPHLCNQSTVIPDVLIEEHFALKLAESEAADPLADGGGI